MSLIHGVKLKSPCPICFAKNNKFMDLTKTWPLRMATHTQEIIQQARELTHTQKHEALLSSRGLHNVNVSITPFSCFIPLIDSCQPTHRMYSGTCNTQTCIACCPSIGSIPTTVASLVITCGRLSKTR